jgi:hypothetical protein
MNAKLIVVAASTLCVVGTGRGDRDISEAARAWEDLPQSVVETIQQQPGGRHPTEIEEIRYEGVPVLYEFELNVDGRDRDVLLRPNGELVQPEQHEGQGDGLYERTVTIGDLPRAAADALRAVMDGREAEEIEEVRFEHVVVLYEVEIGGNDGADELYIYPYGAIATQEGDVIEREVVARDLPKAVADTLVILRGRDQADEIDEIRFEGIPILYEAEVGPEESESEVLIHPDGRLAGHEDGDVEMEGGIEEREVDFRDLPRAVAELVRHFAAGGQVEEVEEIRYDGILVLYDVEVLRDGTEYDLYVYPSGKMAESQRDDDDDDDDGDDDDDDDDDDGDDDDDD